MWDEVEYREVRLSSASQVKSVAEFLARFSLSFEDLPEYTIAAYKSDRLVATGSFRGEVLRNIAIDESFQGDGLAAGILSRLMAEQGRQGIFHQFLFTRPAKENLFAGVGFTEIARAEPFAVLLEAGMGSVSDFIRQTERELSALPIGRRAGLVMNCNPFTLGHRYLIETAAAENEAVVVFVVSEDRSSFSFADRLRLVRNGTSDLKNVLVLPGGRYILSAASFPAYFTRREDMAAAQATLDVDLFSRRIAPELQISIRYVGEEPLCPVTRVYNETLERILPPRGIAVRVIRRKETAGGVVSASRVRSLLAEGNIDALSELLPETTLTFLQSPEAAPVISRLRQNPAAH